MSDHEARVHVGVERTIRNSDGSNSKLTINLSGIPATSGDDLVAAMIGRANVALDLIAEELEARVRGVIRPKTVDPSVFETHPDEIAKKIEELANGLLAKPENPPFEIPEYDPFAEDAPSTGSISISTLTPLEPAEPKELSVFPSEEEAGLDLYVFGVRIPTPQSDWAAEPITEKQMVAVNAALTGIGWGNKLRHAAANAVLIEASGSRQARVESIKDVTKFEAAVILSWIDSAHPDSIARMAQATKEPAVA